MKKLLLLWLIVLFGCTTDGIDDLVVVREPGTPTYNLTVTAGAGGSVSPTSGTYNSGSQVTITATANSGFTFNGWSNGSSNNPLTLVINSNTELSASFLAIPTYTINLTAGDGGVVSGGGRSD